MGKEVVLTKKKKTHDSKSETNKVILESKQSKNMEVWARKSKFINFKKNQSTLLFYSLKNEKRKRKLFGNISSVWLVTSRWTAGTLLTQYKTRWCVLSDRSMTRNETDWDSWKFRWEERRSRKFDASLARIETTSNQFVLDETISVMFFCSLEDIFKRM